MKTNAILRVLADILTQLNRLRLDAVAASNRLIWLDLLDSLDALKYDLQSGGGANWPPDGRELYVALRTGVKELFDQRFATGHPLERYEVDRLTAYRDRLQKFLAPYTPAKTS